MPSNAYLALAAEDDWGGKNDKTGPFAHYSFHAIPDAKPLRTLLELLQLTRRGTAPQAHIRADVSREF